MPRSANLARRNRNRYLLARRRKQRQTKSSRRLHSEDLEARLVLTTSIDTGAKLDVFAGGYNEHAISPAVTLDLDYDGVTITADHVEALAEVAIERWVDAGATPDQVEVLQLVDYQVHDLDGHKLAFAHNGTITIDENAAGHLWYVDSTPGLDEEFDSESTTQFIAQYGEFADGKIDLLTAIMHEQGHILGVEGASLSVDHVMNEALQPGVRRLPEFGYAFDAIAGSLKEVEYLTSDATGGGQSFSTVQPYVTCLLYTSPSPRDATLSRMPSSA